MHKEESQTEFGQIQIHNNVITSVSAIAAMDVSGIKRIGGPGGISLLSLFSQKDYSAIKVKKDKHDEFSISIPIIVKYGFNIPDTANKVQENVRYALEKTAGLIIKEINVIVQTVERDLEPISAS